MRRKGESFRSSAKTVRGSSLHKIVIADSREMLEVPDESVHLVVTSPPYWQLKDYGHKGQIGFDDTYEEYINNLNLVWNECYRVLHPGCRLCVNIGDQFARAAYYGRYKVIPIRTEIIRFCEAIGFDSMGAIIWQKVTTTNTTGGASVMGSYPYPRNGILKIDYEFILIFKKRGDGPKPSRKQKEDSRISESEWNEYFCGHWNFPGERQKGHLAMFPEELPRRLIKMFTFVGETVLDPFLGSGTTALAARGLQRNSMGYEANASFLPLIKQKLGVKTVGSGFFEILKRPAASIDLGKRLALLPYRFVDPVTIDKKVDPRKKLFGSKISELDSGSKKGLTVTEVLGGNRIRLSSGATVELIGVRAGKQGDLAAQDYLRSAALKKHVFLKECSEWRASNGNACAYVYLENKTFLNAHLIKRGLMLPSTKRHRLSEQFLKYAALATRAKQ